MKIDNNIIKNIKRNPNKYKNEKFSSNEILQKEFYTSFKNYESSLLDKTSYENALWIDSNEKHLSAVNNANTIKYSLGDILLVDLGWNNYDREFAYIHPAIVIKETYDKIFIVPCTSEKPRVDKKGNVYPEFIVGTTNDWFQKNSVVMLYEAKYIDKNRVISPLGKVTDTFFDKIYNKLFEQLFESKYYEIKKLKNK